uniref:Uncharacterized protein n=1 Tax=Anopheles coluzzii TaxID=1518534 RepID=A0A8W7Q3Q4_ANOCL
MDRGRLGDVHDLAVRCDDKDEPVQCLQQVRSELLDCEIARIVRDVLSAPRIAETCALESSTHPPDNLPSGNTARIFRYDVVSRMIDALSSCDVIALGSGSSFASSRNSAFSFSRLDRAAFLLFSFIADRVVGPGAFVGRRS